MYFYTHDPARSVTSETIQIWKQALYHVLQSLAAQHVAATGATFRVNGGRRAKWADRRLAVGHQMWVCSMVISNGNRSCGLEKVPQRKGTLTLLLASPALSHPFTMRQVSPRLATYSRKKQQRHRGETRLASL
jgi:hypothetical protein